MSSTGSWRRFLLLAAALATLHEVRGLAVACTLLQLALQVLLRRRPSDPDQAPSTARARRAATVLTTQAPPDLARLDVVRGTWCRTLVADALLLGRQASAWVAVAPGPVCPWVSRWRAGQR